MLLSTLNTESTSLQEVISTPPPLTLVVTYLPSSDRCVSRHPQSTSTGVNAELFRNCLEAMVETCWSAGDHEPDVLPACPSLLSVSSTVNASSSLSSPTVGSPTEKGTGADTAPGGETFVDLVGFRLSMVARIY